ncbi:MAG: DEAD/DEAH box helicase [Desulfovibrio sp.]|nr:DEAD/DEAH box helicase [Desulfovibrio sp.]
MAKDASQTILLARTGRLKWENDDLSWQQRWFELGAKRKRASDPVVHFWQQIAAACITQLAHIASPDPDVSDTSLHIAGIPLPEEAQTWLEEAPPMPGGEFLDLEMLSLLWSRLLEWCQSETAVGGRGLAGFLKECAPQWQHVGRIFFHLAENKQSEDHPFAFLATYTVGLNELGQPRHVPLSHALQRYLKANDKPALLRLLDPLFKASKRVVWVESMVADKTIYQPRPWTPKEAYAFLCSAEILQECGLGTRLPNWWKKRSRPKVKATLETRNPSFVGADALINVGLSVLFGDGEYTSEEIQQLLQNCEDGLVYFNGQWVEVDKEKLRQALDYWEVVQKQAENGELTFAKGMRLLAGVPESSKDQEEALEIRAWSFSEAGSGFQELLKAARLDLEHLEIEGLQATLRPYQARGVEWLAFLGRLGLGCCLADDMGLGKTIQILALILRERDGRPNLLIAPASLLANWQAEAARFTPSLRLLLLHGKSKALLESYGSEAHALDGYDLVLVSYSGCARLPWLANYPWKRVIADEAQAIKNASTNQSRSVRAIGHGAHIALTGTPVENSLTDLWAIFDFLNPGLLGSARAFRELTKAMAVSDERFAPLKRLTAPYILRRMKTDKSVIDCLPDKTEMPLYCELSKRQAEIYVSITEKLKNALNDLARDPDAQNKRRVIVLQSLMLLKQVCNHPDQASSGGEYKASESGKFTNLAELCSTIAQRQEKVLVFTQFQQITAPLANFLQGIFKTPGLVMHGGIPVKERRELVEAFQSPDGPPFFVLTLKVGGTGLTLTEANHVVHFDRWWNPAVEDQATDRAFRIGQKKNVLVHKCICRGTLEEKIDEMITSKRALAGEILGDTAEVNITSLSDEEIVNLVRLDAAHLAE